jgi:hypothetical protein
MGDITFSNLSYQSAGSQKKVVGKMTLSADYATGGDVFNIKKIGLAQLSDLVIEDSDGYAFNFINTDAVSYANIMAFLGAGGGTIGNEAAHTHAAGAITVTPNAVTAGTPSGTVAAPTITSDSAGTPAGSVAAPTFTGDALGTHQHDAITAGTPAGTNAASAVTASYLPDYAGIVAPAIKLTYNADPAGGLGAAPLFIVEALAGASSNCGQLQSNCASTTSILGETADGSVYLAAASARFWVTHNLAPAGVQIYVNEASSYQLEFVSPTATDAVILMPMENGAGIGAPFIKVVVHHSATAATGKALYFDDNGAADAQLCFVAADTSDHAVPPSDIVAATVGASLGADGSYGSATAQVFSGSALGTHQHAAITAGTPSGSNSAPAFTGSALSNHTHTAGAPAFTGAALGTHQHADTASGAATGAGSAHSHTSTGGASGEAPAHTNLSAVVLDFVAYGY